MAYPKSSPYDILQASPDDNNQELRAQWSKMIHEHPERINEISMAFRELSKNSSRLKQDILIITGVPEIEDVDSLVSSLAHPQYLTGNPSPLPFSLSLTEVVEDQNHFYKDLSLPESTVERLEHYEKLEDDALMVRFDI